MRDQCKRWRVSGNRRVGLRVLWAWAVGLVLTGGYAGGCSLLAEDIPASVPAVSAVPVSRPASYAWTTDHMQVGVRWQPFVGRPKNNAYDATRPVFTQDSSYVHFWVSWPGIEPTPAHRDYTKRPSPLLQTIEAAVDACVAARLKVEFVLLHCPGWASVSGQSGGWKPKPDHFGEFVTRIARHFKGRVHSYQLYHEANLKSLMQDGDIDYLMSEIFMKGAQAVRRVYDADPAEPVVISTSGCSPCHMCPTLTGLDGVGGLGINDFYDQLIGNRTLMNRVDALNINVSDHLDGYGGIDDRYVTSTWGSYDLVRRKLDARGYRGKKILAAESWISWDDGRYGIDVNGDGVGNEQDAYRRTLTILGQCFQRGLNTMNLPWSDNSSEWAMGLTKRRDYNGRVKALQPEMVIPASDGGPDVVTQKIRVHGGDDNFTIHDPPGNVFTIEDYIDPSDPNHLHYYVWRWYAQIAGGPDEVIRHAMADQLGNDIAVWGPGYRGKEKYRISSYNRTRDRFLVLVYASGANGRCPATVSIPATIQRGFYYNNEFSRLDFRGEGFAKCEPYYARVVTKDISMQNGADVDVVRTQTGKLRPRCRKLTVTVPRMNKFTTIEFIRAASGAGGG